MSLAVSNALFGVNAYGVFLNFKADTATVEQLAIFTNGKIKMRYGSTGDFVDIVDNTSPSDEDEDGYDYDFIMANVFGAGRDK